MLVFVIVVGSCNHVMKLCLTATGIFWEEPTPEAFKRQNYSTSCWRDVNILLVIKYLVSNHGSTMNTISVYCVCLETLRFAVLCVEIAKREPSHQFQPINPHPLWPSKLSPPNSGFSTKGSRIADTSNWPVNYETCWCWEYQRGHPC